MPDRIVKPIVSRVYRTLAFGDPATADPDVVATFAGHLAGFARSMGVLDTGRRLLPELSDPFELERIDCPLLLIWGERDRMVFMTGAERVLRTVDYSDIEVIPDCGHCPQVEVPDVLAELLLDFPEQPRVRALLQSDPAARSGRGLVGGRLVDLGVDGAVVAEVLVRGQLAAALGCRRSARPASARRGRTPTSSRSRWPAGGGR